MALFCNLFIERPSYNQYSIIHLFTHKKYQNIEECSTSQAKHHKVEWKPCAQL